MSVTLPFSKDDVILELGGGSDPIFHPNMDIRELPSVDIVTDITERWPLEDNSFDGVFSKYLIEHIGWRKVPFVISEMCRVLKPGGLAVIIGPDTLEQCKEVARRNRITIDENAMIFGGQDFAEGGDGEHNAHRSAFSPQYITDLMEKAGFESTTIERFAVQTDMIVYAKKKGNRYNEMKKQEWFKDIESTLNKKSDKIKLNLGSFTVMEKDYINIDIIDLTFYAREKGYEFKNWDIRRGLPYDNNSVEKINMSHLIEHIQRKEGKKLLRECYRVLEPNGKVMVTFPDLEKMTKKYLDGKVNEYDFNEGVKNAEDDADAFWKLATAGHITAYDSKSVRKILEEIGYTNIKVFDDISEYEGLKIMYPELSVFIVGEKPEKEIQKKLKIAMISTPMLKVPPDRYGGLEQIVYDTAISLAELGHDVTVFAPKGSSAPGCKIFETLEAENKVDTDWREAERKAYEIYKNELVKFDIIHDHTWFGFAYLLKREKPEIKVIHTHHGGLNWRSKPCNNPNLIAISDFMVRVYGQQGFQSKRVYNGVDLDKYKFKKTKSNRLLFVGRLDTFKQPDVAIRAVKKLGYGLDIVGGSFVQDKDFLEKIKLECDGKQICLHLDASHEDKIKLYQNAKAVLFPSRMGEPFGLIVPEANACGTPVIGLRDGAIPETITDGLNGYVVGSYTTPESETRKAMDVEAIIEGIKRLEKNNISADKCRKAAEKFSRQEMTKAYLEMYMAVILENEW